MQRREHYIKRNKRNSRPKCLLFFDTEAQVSAVDNNTQEHKFLFGWWLFWRRRWEENKHEQVEMGRFDSPDELLRVINEHTANEVTLHVFAHNIIYDIALTGLDKLLEADGWELLSAYSKNDTLIIRLKKGKRRLVILDNMNLFPGTLKGWAKVVGIEKVDVDFENPDLAELDRRCQNDVKIMFETHKYWSRILDDEDLGDWRPTVGSQALNTFRHKFMSHKIKVHVDKEAIWAERMAYGGGMVKVVHWGRFTDRKIYKLDVNSMYPYVMLSNYYPVAYVGKLKEPTVEKLRGLVNVACVIVDATILPDIPAYRRKTKEKVIYPMYPFRTVITTREVERLLRADGIKEIHAVYVYRRRKIFEDYVRYFYEKRKEAKEKGHKVQAQMYKLLLNSLYGKFAARSGSFKRCPEWDYLTKFRTVTEGFKDGKKIPVLVWADKAYALEEEEEAEDAFVAIAAHVTADARMYLGELMDIAGYKETYYCDTDSIFVSQKGYERLKDFINPDELGKLKLEGVSEDTEIWGRKFYKFGDKYTIKGVSRVTVEDGKIKAYKELWPTFNTTIRDGAVKDNKIQIIQKEINLCTDVKDGIVSDDGFVIPYYVAPDFDPDPLALTP